MSSPAKLDVATTLARLQAASRVIITTHARADGDAVACAVAMQRLLRQNGKSAAAHLHEPILDRYAFLSEFEPLAVWDAANAAGALAQADLILLVDTCAATQLGKIADAVKAAPGRKLAIDHHVTRDGIADEALIDEQAGACVQIIVKLCDQAAWPIDATLATILYTGLATDTGWFRFSNADRDAFAIAARLVQAGARPNELYERLYLSDCEARLRLIAAVLSSFELYAGGRLAVVRITQAMLTRCGATREMTEEIINEPQRMGSVEACVLFVEPVDDGLVRVSFRSKHSVDVAAIAARFGGGGHERAAGARISGTLDNIAARVIPMMIAAIEGAA